VPVMLFSPSGKKLGNIRPGRVLNEAPLGIIIARTGRQ
jgi:hypothetical protein